MGLCRASWGGNIKSLTLKYELALGNSQSLISFLPVLPVKCFGRKVVQEVFAPVRFPCSYPWPPLNSLEKGGGLK